jgi:hypothetical protein
MGVGRLLDDWSSPAAAIAFGLGARRYASEPVRSAGSAGTTANCLVIYRTTLLVAVGRRQPGCEGTLPSNWIFRF